MVKSKHVVCEYCEGNRTVSLLSWSPEDGIDAESIPCPGCDGTGLMEIRKSEEFDWASCCLTCKGKGFNDSRDNEQHVTEACAECNATGGIPYPQITE